MKGILSISLLAALCGCRPPSVVPPPGGGDIPGPGGDKTVSISYLKTLYKGAPLLITDEVRIAGAVVSDDGQGNFYNTLVLDDGTAGIEVRLDMEDIHKRFWIHSRATVRCNGLWLGSYGGTLQLGAGPFGDFQTRPLPPADIAEHIFADNGFYGEVKPRVLRFSELSQRHVSTFVAFEGVSFAPEEKGLSWAETADGENGTPPPSATDRRLVDAAGGTLAVRTSRHARFAAWPLPEGTGRIEGVLGYFGGDYQLTVWSSECFSAVTP